MNILAFDPSQEYTGYCILDVKKRQIIEYDCITILDLFYEETGKSIKQLKRSDAYVFRQQFALRFSQKISSIFEYNPDITEVALEFPHGSRNAKGAWGLGLSSGIISGIVINELGWKSYLLYSQSDAKEYMFNRTTVEKKETMNLMWSLWEKNGIMKPEIKWKGKNELRQRKEAVADAMLILNLHLHERIL